MCISGWYSIAFGSCIDHTLPIRACNGAFILTPQWTFIEREVVPFPHRTVRGSFWKRVVQVGDAVEARVSMMPPRWAPGTINAIGYREPSFPPGILVPYQIQLDSGQFIFAPHDTSEVVRPSSGGRAPDLTSVGPEVPGGGHGHSHGGLCEGICMGDELY